MINLFVFLFFLGVVAVVGGIGARKEGRLRKRFCTKCKHSQWMHHGQPGDCRAYSYKLDRVCYCLHDEFKEGGPWLNETS